MPAASSTFRFDAFVFTHRVLDASGVRLGFRLERRADGSRIDFEETLAFPASWRRPGPTDDPAVARALRGLHVAAGPSYWKTCLPETIVLEGDRLSDDDAGFWSEVYTKGLGEFFYRNGIDPEGRVRFPGGGGSAAIAASGAGATRGSLVLWGGGKDSVVAREALASAGERHELLTVGRGDWAWIGRSATIAGVPAHRIERRIDPGLLAMNEAGALNGHVPVSAYLAFASQVVALACGHAAVVAANESSASEGNATWRGIDVNHQWSKSLEFERLFRAWQARNVPGAPEYVSLLRPLTELRIVKEFTTHRAYFDAVTSCNRNFAQTGAAPRRWCLACAKCVFVAAMARPWLDDAAYRALFDGDPLADPRNVDLVASLLGLTGVKPFECVGTPEETMAAFHLARSRGLALPHGCMTLFAQAVAARNADLEALVARSLSRSDAHALSRRWLEVLDGYLDRR